MNVILLTVDSLRWDHISRNGYNRILTPEIDSMMSKSMFCDSTYTLCSSTAGAFPSIMTSTLPLSYGGFDRGVLDRPQSLSSSFAGAGYEVTHLSTVPWVNSHLGYSVGVHNNEMLFGFGMLARTGTPLIRRTLTRYLNNEITEDELTEAADRVLPAYFESLIEYCKTRLITPISGGKIYNSIYGNQSYRWESLIKQIEHFRYDYNKNKIEFLEKASIHYMKTGRWLLDKSWRSKRVWIELIRDGLRNMLSHTLKPINRNLANRLRFHCKEAIDSDILVDKVLFSALNSASQKKQFFIWTHIFDCHIPYTTGTGDAWLDDSSFWLRQVGYNNNVDPTLPRRIRPKSSEEWADWCALYDASIRFIDHHIGRLCKSLKKMGLADTLIVVTSDHGEELNEHGDSSHRFRLYEHNVRVNTFYYHPDFNELKVKGLSTLMDVAPTIADLAAVQKPYEWEGKSLLELRHSPREIIVLESTFGSPSDPNLNPIYMAVRKGKYKLMHTEVVDPRDTLSKIGTQLYDIEIDPTEQNDISQEMPDVVQELLNPINARLQKLRTIGNVSDSSVD